MGFFGRLFGRKDKEGGDGRAAGARGPRRGKGRELWVREDYRDHPMHEWTDDEYDHFMATCSEEEYWQEWEAWSRETVGHPRVKRVRADLLRLAAEAARASHPQEFASLLRVEGDTVTELVLLPGTIQGDEHAIFQLWMQPVDRSVRGSLHSHPSPHPYPSDADFELFEKHGEIHLILGHPYGPDDWRAYGHDGTPVHLEVVDVPAQEDDGRRVMARDRREARWPGEAALSEEDLP